MPPGYVTVNITRAAPGVAANWAVGVVPPHPRLRVRCPYGGPDGEARFLARAAGYRRWWWGWWRR